MAPVVSVSSPRLTALSTACLKHLVLSRHQRLTSNASTTYPDLLISTTLRRLRLLAGEKREYARNSDANDSASVYLATSFQASSMAETASTPASRRRATRQKNAQPTCDRGWRCVSAEERYAASIISAVGRPANQIATGSMRINEPLPLESSSSRPASRGATPRARRRMASAVAFPTSKTAP